MIALYNNVRSSTGSSDTFPSMPMYEYDLLPTIQSLEFLKQSLESYLNELPFCHVQISIDDERQSKSENDDDDIRDSALDTFSETSSLIEPIKQNILPMNNLQGRLSISSDDKKTLTSSSSNKDDNEELTSQFIPVLISNGQIDRQISDEGYRSVRNDQQQQVISNHNSPLLTRSKSYNCVEKVDQWLSNVKPITTLASSVPVSITYQTDEGRNLDNAKGISVFND
jgi:hypothetical protein